MKHVISTTKELNLPADWHLSSGNTIQVTSADMVQIVEAYVNRKFWIWRAPEGTAVKGFEHDVKSPKFNDGHQYRQKMPKNKPDRKQAAWEHTTKIWKTIPRNEVITLRKSTNTMDHLDMLMNNKKDTPLCDIMLLQGDMMNADDTHILSFANEVAGGGILKGGFAQEETLFVTNPACWLFMIFHAEAVKPGESLHVGNSPVCGYMTMNYGNKYGKQHTGPMLIPNFTYKNHRVCISSADATNWKLKGPLAKAASKYEDYKPGLLKVYSAFEPHTGNWIATSHWGAGAFAGDKLICFVIQLIAATVAGVKLRFYGDLSPEMWQVYDSCKNVGDVVTLLKNMGNKMVEHKRISLGLSTKPQPTAGSSTPLWTKR